MDGPERFYSYGWNDDFGKGTAMFRSILAAALVLSASAVSALSIEPLPVPADGEQFWGLGTTGIYCVKAPCPWRGVFRIPPTRAMP